MGTAPASPPRSAKPALALALTALAAVPVAIAIGAAGASPAPAGPRAVLEMFTSQGCSACPPADALMLRYAQDRAWLALSYPVQIWDHLGWRDTLATPDNTERQRAYAMTRGDRQVYTPQAVINGERHAPGASSEAIEAKAAARAGPGPAALAVAVDLEASAAGLTVAVAPWPGPGAPPAARLVVVTFERRHTITIERGENQGRVATYAHVVRSITDHGPWTGSALRAPLAMPTEGRGVAVLLQAGTLRAPGVILGAARTE